MRNYYIECEVKFTNIDDKSEEIEHYEYIIEANSEKSAIKKAEKRALTYCKEEVGEYGDNFNFTINEIWETSEDARL